MVRSIREDFVIPAKFGSGALFILNFVIESALFNDFLHQEAVQLCLNVLKISNKYCTCEQHKWLYKKAMSYGLVSAIEANNQWGFLNPWSGDSFKWIYSSYSTRIQALNKTC